MWGGLANLLVCQTLGAGVGDEVEVGFEGVYRVFLADYEFRCEALPVGETLEDSVDGLAEGLLDYPACGEACEVDGVVEEVGGFEHLQDEAWVGGLEGFAVVDGVEPRAGGAGAGYDGVVFDCCADEG